MTPTKTAWMLCLPLLATPVSADEQASAQDKILPWPWADQLANDVLDYFGADGEFDPNKGIDWGLVPGPIYSPEKSFGIGLSAVGLYLADSSMASFSPSSITVKAEATVNGSLGIETEVRHHRNGDRQRWYLDAEISDSPQVYFGSGIAAGREQANQVEYDRHRYRFAPQLLQQVGNHSYVGFGVDWQHSGASGVTPVTEALQDSSNLGLTARWLYDSRDFALNASQGRYLSLQLQGFNASFGSEHDFAKLIAEFASYHQWQQSTIAWQVQTELSDGTVPWDQQASLGGSRKLRGYEQGRYRDNQMLLTQLELRQPLYGRHGMVAWAGMGTLAAEIDQLGQGKWLHSIGVGYRFAVKANTNLRLDLGFGNGDSGAYLSINEVF